MKRLALMDGDEIAFKAQAVTATTIDWGDGEGASAPSPALAMKAARELVESWAGKVDAEKIVICLSCRDRDLFRRALFPEYKQERTEKPEAFWAVINMFEADYDTREFPRLEADDVMGILSTPKAWKNEYQPIIVSSDKDMRTVPAWVFAPYHGTKKKISLVQANEWWMTQTLTGDTVDGFKGLPGAGPKLAEKTLEGFVELHHMWRAVVDAYRKGTPKCKGGLPEHYALTMARLARILRPEDYNVETGVIQLWHPSQSVPFYTKETK